MSSRTQNNVIHFFQEKNRFPLPEAIIYAEQDSDKVHNYSWLDQLSLVGRDYFACKFINNRRWLMIVGERKKYRMFLQQLCETLKISADTR